MNGPTLAAITLDPRGGGVAAVARLLWQVCQDRWRDDARLVTLLDDSQRIESLSSTKAMRLRFGARLARAQVRGDSGLLLYSHLSLAQVQGFIPGSMRRPYAVFLHGIEAWRPLSRAQRSALEGASLLIANSNYTAKRVAAAHPWIGPIAPCPLSLCPPSTSDVRSGGSTPLGRFPALGPHAVLVVARMAAAERYKGHDELLEAWPTVRSQVPDAQLVFAGGGDDVSRLSAKAERLQISDSVIFTGFVGAETLETLYRHAALFAMPSRNEGFGLVYLEAMSHALPCVGSIRDAASEIIEDGVSGALVRQSDVDGLAALISRLLADEPLRRRMGLEGRRRLENRFTYARFSDRLASLLTSVADPSERLVASAASS